MNCIENKHDFLYKIIVRFLPSQYWNYGLRNKWKSLEHLIQQQFRYQITNIKENLNYQMDQNGAIKTIGKYSYYMQKCLGEGSFGKVFQGFENTTKQKVAIKKVDFKTLQKDSYLQKAIHDQIRILSKFKHQNIVQLYEVLNSKRSLYIIMEYCKDGDLKKYLKSKKTISDAQAYQIMKQIVKGYQQLAKQNTIHRDLKPANILINNGLFKICDFGFSKVIKDPTTALKTCVGSPIYMAPQILQKKDYSAKCDIWSLGIIYYQMLHGTVPWTAKSQKQLLDNIKNIPIKFNPNYNVKPSTQKMIRMMLQVRQENRASLRDLQKYFCIQLQSNPPSIIQQKTNFQKSYTSIPTKLINRHYFEELAWRYFVCCQIKYRLPLLNRYNFTKNNFERLIVLIISSIMCNFQRRYSQIQRIHEPDTVVMVMRDLQTYRQFQSEYFNELSKDYVTCQILQQFQYTDIARKNFTQEVVRKSEKLIFKLVDSLLKQIQTELKVIQQKTQRSMLLYVAQLMLDLLAINQKQAKQGTSDVAKFMKDRQGQQLDKRVIAKLGAQSGIPTTQFF